MALHRQGDGADPNGDDLEEDAMNQRKHNWWAGIAIGLTTIGVAILQALAHFPPFMFPL